MNYNYFHSEIFEAERELSQLTAFLEHAPEGRLIIRTRNQLVTEYYQKITDPSGKVREIYLSRLETQKIKALAWKSYVLIRVKELKGKIRRLSGIQPLLDGPSQSQLFLETHPRIKELAEEYLQPSDAFLRKWAEEDYPRKPDRQEDLKYPTVYPRLFVRSKSEADIISRLSHFKVPFHYEEALQSSSGRILYPDLKCLSLSTRKLYWWEHKGRYDDPVYVQNSIFRRDELLYQAGLIPWKNLIITTETYEQPLDLHWVDEIIKYYLL